MTPTDEGNSGDAVPVGVPQNPRNPSSAPLGDFDLADDALHCTFQSFRLVVW
jgi:hypothetical protein